MYTDSPVQTRLAGEALPQFRLLKLDASNQFVFADAGEQALAVCDGYTPSGEPAAATLLSKPGTLTMVAAGAINFRAKVYSAADGKITATNTGFCVGLALAAAAAEDDQIEVLPLVSAFPAEATIAPAALTYADPAAQTSAALTGTLTGTANGALVDVAAAAGACAGGDTPTAAQVDTAIATAVAPIVSGTNEQLKELQTQLNAAVADLTALRTKLVAAGADLLAQKAKTDALIAACKVHGIVALA